MRSTSKLPALLFGLIILAVGILFSWGLLRAYNKAKAQEQWDQATATILESALIESRATPNSNLSYHLELKYSYRYGGRDCLGSKVSRIEGASSKKKKVQRLMKNYPVGSSHPCYINPQQSDLVVLELDSKAVIYNIWYPGLFVLGGLGIILGSLLPSRATSRMS